jgi:hypothetical protein
MTDRRLDRIRFVTGHFRELQGLRDRVPLGLLLLSAGGTTYFDNREFVLLRLLLVSGAVLLAFGARFHYWSRYGEVEPESLLASAPEPTLSIFSPAGAPSLIASPPETLAARRIALTATAALVLFLLLRAFGPKAGFDVDESLVQVPWSSLSRPVVFHFGGEPFVSLSTYKAAIGQFLYVLCGAFAVATWVARGRRLSQLHHLALGLPLLALSGLNLWLDSLVTIRPATFPLVTWAIDALVNLWVAILLCGLSLIVSGLLDHLQLVRAFRHPARPREVS